MSENDKVKNIVSVCNISATCWKDLMKALKAHLHIHGSDHSSLRFVTVSKIVENRDETWSESSFLRMPRNNHGAAMVSYDLSTVFLRVHAGLCRGSAVAQW